jgi:L-histidine N-alpha-methyltransferase
MATATQRTPQDGREEFAGDVRDGLSQPQKQLPSKYLYDELGSLLFEAITALPEYGLTRADQRLIQRYARQIANGYRLVAELGSGSGAKTRPILAAMEMKPPVAYYPIDLSMTALDRCRKELAGAASIHPIEASYNEGIRGIVESRNGSQHLLILFLGSSIGNFDSRAAEEFLASLRRLLRPGDAMLIGFDLVKPIEVMLEAYDDPTGVTAAFNKNILGRINRELGGRFDPRAFAHEVRYEQSERRIEMHLRSLKSQTVPIQCLRQEFSFQEGETIWTESSHKYTSEQIGDLATATGFLRQAEWVDDEWPFAESFWVAR